MKVLKREGKEKADSGIGEIKGHSLEGEHRRPVMGVDEMIKSR